MLRFLTAGESHGPCLTAIVEGLPAGLPVDPEAINHELARRQGGYGRGGRMAIEQDRVEILGGVLYGQTIGAPVALRIPNRDWENWQPRWAAGLPPLTVPRPGHADYAGMIKYNLDDARLVLERASARETASRVAAGSLAKQLLAACGVAVGSYVVEIGAVTATIPDLPPAELWALAEASPVRCPDPAASERICAAIDAARAAGDSLGGVFCVTATGVPAGLGSYVQWDRRLDARLGAALLSIPAVKGVEIGPAFENARRPGTQVHDGFEPGRPVGRIVKSRRRDRGRHQQRPAGGPAGGDEADPHHRHAAALGRPGQRAAGRRPSTSAPTCAPCRPRPSSARRWSPGCWRTH